MMSQPQRESWKESEAELFRLLVENVKDYAVFVIDPKGRVQSWNPGAERLLGYREDEIIGQSAEVFFTPEDIRAGVPQQEVRAALQEGRGNDDRWHVRKDGSRFWSGGMMTPLWDEARKLRGFAKIMRDRTEWKQAEQVRHASEARQAAILETALDAIITINHQGRVMEFNPAAEALFGYARTDVRGRDIGELIVPPRLREAHRLGMARYLSTGEGPVLGKRIEMPALRADGTEITVELAITRIPTDGPPLFTAYLRDISEKTRIDRYRSARLAVTQVLAQAATISEAATSLLRAVCENLGWDVGFFWALGPSADALNCLESWHTPGVTTTKFEAASRQRSFRRGEGLPGHAWATGKPAWLLDVVKATNFPRVASAAEEGLHGAFACPLVVGSETLGVIEFFSKRIQEPDPDLLETMATVTGLVGQFVERKLAEDQLRQSERELADFFENATVGLHWVGPDGIILRANQAELDLLGYEPEEYVGRPISDFHADEDVICDILKRLQAGEKLAEYPARLRCKDGSIKDVLIDSSVLWKDGHFVHTRCFTRDVTEHKRAEDRVRFQARMLDTVGQAAIVTDPDGTIIYWNHFAEKLYGWARDEALGRNVIEVVVAPEATAQAAEIMSRLRAAENWSGEFPVRRRDGTTFTAFVTDTPLFDEQGKLKAIIGVSVDISDRKRVEQSLRFLADASATLATIVDYQSTLQKVAALAVPHFADWCAVDMTESGGTLRRLAVAHVDPAKVKLAQELEERYPAKQDGPHGAYHVLHTGKSEMMSAIPDALLVETARDEDHLRILRELGLKSYMCVPLQARGKTLGVISFVTAESGRSYTDSDLAFAEELARRSAIAIENAQLYAELRDTDRRKDEFLATLAHELRNPLAPIRNSLQILNMPRVDPETVQRSREMMERQVHHLVRLVDDLLDVSRVMRGKIELRKERVELATVVARAVETVQPLADAQGHELTVRLPSESLPIDADPVRLAQVVGNLLTNAAKYTEPNSHIWLTAERDGDMAVLRVRDNGIGIAPAMLPRIFELFVQVDHAATKSQGGLGIGLTLVKNLVEMHNGTVEAHSAGLGEGSEFTVRLPISAQGLDQEQSEEHGQQAHQQPTPSGYRLLVVDDNQDAANSLAMLLKLQGHDVRVAYGGVAALEMTKAFAPDVVFLDIGMPGMDGYEVARRLRRQSGLKNVVLAALTGWGQKEDRRRSTEAGFNHHLVKPPEPKALESVLAGLKSARR